MPPLQTPVILASGSPRRRTLMLDAGYDFTVITADVTEPKMIGDNIPASIWAETMAYYKARAVFEKHSESIVIGADTVSVHGKHVLGKPKDEDDARFMLTEMFGGCNAVITGVAILAPSPAPLIVTHVTSSLVMKPMSTTQIEAYIASGAWQDKAGGYALQEGGDRFVDHIDGSHSNIVGLPMEQLAILLKQINEQLQG